MESHRLYAIKNLSFNAKEPIVISNIWRNILILKGAEAGTYGGAGKSYVGVLMTSSSAINGPSIPTTGFVTIEYLVWIDLKPRVLCIWLFHRNRFGQ